MDDTCRNIATLHCVYIHNIRAFLMNRSWEITEKKLRISISRSFHIHQWVARFQFCGRRKIQNTVTRWIAIFLRTRKMNRKKFQFQNQSWPISTAGDMYFNFATETRRKSFLDFWHYSLKRWDSDISEWHWVYFKNGLPVWFREWQRIMEEVIPSDSKVVYREGIKDLVLIVIPLFPAISPYLTPLG